MLAKTAPLKSDFDSAKLKNWLEKANRNHTFNPASQRVPTQCLVCWGWRDDPRHWVAS